VAADVSNLEEAERLARELAGLVSHVKVGLELFTAGGPEAVERVLEHAAVFLDLKLHDIPNTVGRAARNAARLGASMLTVHALGGMPMVRAGVSGAEEGAAQAGFPGPKVLGVTILSSLGGEGLVSPLSLAYEAVTAGAAGVVVSGPDVQSVRETLGDEPLVVVPGIRPPGGANGDQVRVLTPMEALASGADYIVVGRPITESQDPAAAARGILEGVGAA
jgi:orotidine-5'-phosphate decarboxylase